LEGTIQEINWMGRSLKVLNGLKRSKIFCYNRRHNRDFERSPSEYKSEALPLLRCSLRK
jgi:hypothetical protein